MVPTAEGHSQRGLRNVVREMSGVMQSVYLNQQYLCIEILEIKFSSILLGSGVIHTFQFSLELTSYMAFCSLKYTILSV
jgi:hypothetical protein